METRDLLCATLSLSRARELSTTCYLSGAIELGDGGGCGGRRLELRNRSILEVTTLADAFASSWLRAKSLASESASPNWGRGESYRIVSDRIGLSRCQEAAGGGVCLL